MIHRPRIHSKRVRGSVLRACAQPTRTVRGRYIKVTQVRYRYTVGCQHTIGKGCCGAATRREGSTGSNLYRVTRSRKLGGCIIVGVSCRNLDVKRDTSSLGTDVSSTLSLHQEVIERSRVHRECVRCSVLRTSTQSTGTVRRRYVKASCIGNGYAVRGQYTAGKRCGRSTAG